jgi:poly(3-hydroxybutyrate) depolymerase
MSNGAVMTMRLIADKPNLFAGAAVVAAAKTDAMQNNSHAFSKAVPIIYEFGDEDTIFNINGNIGGKNGTRGTHIGADATLAEFKTLNGCSTVDKY